MFILAGYAGTGKTTLLKHIIVDTLGLIPGESVAFVTPTGKAANVLIRSGIMATTLHKLIYQSIVEEVQVEIKGKKITTERLSFKRRETIEKSIKLIVLDEASMVSNEVILDILKFGVKVLLCGDNAQLPPVEGENAFLPQPDITLSTIVRQEQDNPILLLAQKVREGSPIKCGNYNDMAFVMPKNRLVGAERKRILLKADQIICGRNITRSTINAEIRRLLGYDSSPLPKDGEKLICTQNNWCEFIDTEMTYNLVNGLIGYCVDPVYDEQNGFGFMQFKPDFLDDLCPNVLPFDIGIYLQNNYFYRHNDLFERFDEEGEPVGTFMLNRFEYGYCISCHKAQGSEYDGVVVFDESWAFKEDSARWLYTAVTRAKKKLIILR